MYTQIPPSLLYNLTAVSVPFERGPGPWSEPGDPGLLKFQYYCKFRAPQVGLVAAKSATLLVRFNQDVQDIVVSDIYFMIRFISIVSNSH